MNETTVMIEGTIFNIIWDTIIPLFIVLLVIGYFRHHRSWLIYSTAISSSFFLFASYVTIIGGMLLIGIAWMDSRTERINNVRVINK